jgi:tRNA dimethylallyltransferase
MKQPVFVICGPTAVGKTDLAFGVAKDINAELISADSRQIYIGMDIGTGKDIPAGEHIWMTNIVKPTESFGSGVYHQQATVVINNIHSAHKIPLIVGGTGFYINSLIRPQATQAIPPNQALRQELALKSVPELQQRLKHVDAHRFDTMNHSDQYNPHRLIRAIEVAQSTDHPTASPTDYQARIVGLTAPVDFLTDRITVRVHKRIEQGFEGEVRRLIGEYENFAVTSGGQTMGYQEWTQVVEGTLSKDQAIKQWTKREIDYMKRQLTWFKKQPDIVWFDITAKNWYAEAVNQLKQWAKNI